MRRGSDYTANRQYGWDSSSHDYHTHLSKMERLISIHPDVPHYPNVHLIFNRKAMKDEENRSQQTQLVQPPKLQEPEAPKKLQELEAPKKLQEPEIIKKIKEPQARKKVVFAENKEPGEVDKDKVQFVENEETGERGNREAVLISNIDRDGDAESFIQQRRKNFELCKWATFKA